MIYQLTTFISYFSTIEVEVDRFRLHMVGTHIPQNLTAKHQDSSTRPSSCFARAREIGAKCANREKFGSSSAPQIRPPGGEEL